MMSLLALIVTHLLIIVPTYEGICSNRYGMTDYVRQTIFEIHNQLRSLVARGEAKDNLDGYAPKAARMYIMEYDCKMEKFAGIHAKKCQIRQSERSARKDVGENIYIDRSRRNKTKMAEDAANQWFSELAKYGVGKANIFGKKLTQRSATKIEHYTQMVWQSSTSLGCAIQNCKKMTLFVCNYRNAGNIVGKPIYEVGEPCSGCPRGDGCAYTTEKLCIPSPITRLLDCVT